MVASTARSSCLRIGDDVPVAVQGCDPELEYVPPSPNFDAIILRTASSIEGKNGGQGPSHTSGTPTGFDRTPKIGDGAK